MQDTENDLLFHRRNGCVCVGQNKKSRRDETGTQKEDSVEPGLSASTGFCKSSWKELKGYV